MVISIQSMVSAPHTDLTFIQFTIKCVSVNQQSTGLV